MHTPAGRARRLPRRAAALAAALLLLVSSGPAWTGGHTAAGSPLPLGAAAFHPASMGASAGSAGSPEPGQALPSPTYDVQIGTTFTQNFDAVTYNVTAVAQVDSDGYGPAYLANGLTETGYWYQVGVSYHWPDTTGTFFPTFGFNYEVFGPDGKQVYPPGKGAGEAAFSAAVRSGDSVLLSISFVGTSVQMLALDWSTGATAKASFSSEGSTIFAGDPTNGGNNNGYFTGLMTEWYHVLPATGNEGEVTYTNNAVALTSAWVWADEFQSGSPISTIFQNQTKGPIAITNEQQLYPFAAGGVTAYISAHRFVTGQLTNASFTSVTLTPAATEAGAPSFTADYTAAGQPQTAVLGPGQSVLQADPGSSVTVSIDLSGLGPGDRWVFNGSSGDKVTFIAGTNTTLVYYHLVQETVSYTVAGGGAAPPASSPVVMSYESPPAAASGTASPVDATQVLGTSPVEVYAILGTVASLNGSIGGTPGERWAAGTEAWKLTGPNVLPSPIELYQQYEVSVRYAVVGGGTPPQTPEFNCTAFGSPTVVTLTGNPTTAWFDAGSYYSFTPFLYGVTSTERWQQVGGGITGGQSAGNAVQGDLLPGISGADEAVTGDYVHQYYTSLAVNDPRGGNITGTYSGSVDNGTVSGNIVQDNGWTDAGLELTLNAFANQGWRFEGWTGTGQSSYTGKEGSIDVAVTAPLNESATFYVQLAISASTGLEVAYSSPSGVGTIQGGESKTLYVPPSTNVSLRASPSLFVYSFGSWQGAGTAEEVRPSISLVVGSPVSLRAAASYDYPAIFALAALALLIVIAASVWVRNRRRRRDPGMFVPG